MAGYDLTNHIYGDLKAIRVDHLDSSQHKIWACECTKCGAINYVRSTELHGGKKRTCSYCSGKNVKKKNINKANDTKVNNDNLLNGSDVNYKFDNIKLIEENLLNVPIYFKVAQAINADLTFSPKGLTGLMDKYFNIGNQLEDYINVDWETGDVIPTGSVYNLLTKKNKDDVVTYSTLTTCFENLRDACYRDNTRYLAIPKIGCGRDKLEFEKVYALINEIFGDTDIKVCIFGDYSNDPEYDVEYLGFLLKDMN